MAEKNELEKVQSVFMEFQVESGEQYQYEQTSTSGEGLDRIDVPFDTERFKPDTFFMKLFAAYKQPDEIDDYKFLMYLAKGENEGKNAEFEKKIKEKPILSGLANDYFRSDADTKFPKMTYEDVTERDLFGYPALLKDDLTGKGIWGDCGYRKFEIKLDNWKWQEASDVEVKASLYWYEMEGGNSLENMFEEQIRYDKDKEIFIVYVDTNRLQRAIAENDTEVNKSPKFTGRFEIHQIINTEKTKKVYGFPIQIKVKNTSLDEKQDNPFVDRGVVSIDFGTSATCAAVRAPGREELITLSGEEKRNIKEGDNEYENPTNLMIYNWTEVFRQWERTNRNCPFLTAKSETVDAFLADYDSGYTVEDEYKSVAKENGRRKMDAIIMQLKMVPYRLTDGGNLGFISYDDASRTSIKLVDDVAKEDGLHFDPIAFYGYLLGRAINNPKNDKLYKKYQVTYPAKFNKEVRDKIKTSLEYGLKRSLPYNLQEAKDAEGKPLVTVEMLYSEPEACMGAVAEKQLVCDSKKAKLFAVYDLGGGTMDFSFGMYRAPEGAEAEECNHVLQFFGIDGDEKIGGEKLIHQLAYKIYYDNRNVVENDQIKFVRPQGALKQEGLMGLLDDVYNATPIAETNLNIIKEKLARPLFKYPSEIGDDLQKVFARNEQEATEGSGKVIIDEGDKLEQKEYTLKLWNLEDKPVEVTLTIEGVDDFLKQKLEHTVKMFKEVMEDIFSRHEEEIKKRGITNEDPIEIFLGGHASLQHYVMDSMNEIFKDRKVNLQRIGEGQKKEEDNPLYAVNEKTAVAIGQLRLEEEGIISIPPVEDNSRPPFMFNVGYSAGNEFVCVLRKNETEEWWHKANKVSKSGMANLRYTSSPDLGLDHMEPISEDVSELMEENSNRLTLYLRLVDERTIELALGKNAEPPEETAKTVSIRLS